MCRFSIIIFHLEKCKKIICKMFCLTDDFTYNITYNQQFSRDIKKDRNMINTGFYRLSLNYHFTVIVKYFFATVPLLSLTFTHTFFEPLPENLMEAEVVEEKSCFVLQVSEEEAL